MIMEEQYHQIRRLQLNGVLSTLTKRVNSIAVTNINFHSGLMNVTKLTSGQMRNPG